MCQPRHWRGAESTAGEDRKIIINIIHGEKGRQDGFVPGKAWRLTSKPCILILQCFSSRLIQLRAVRIPLPAQAFCTERPLSVGRVRGPPLRADWMDYRTLSRWMSVVA